MLFKKQKHSQKFDYNLNYDFFPRKSEYTYIIPLGLSVFEVQMIVKESSYHEILHIIVKQRPNLSILHACVCTYIYVILIIYIRIGSVATFSLCFYFENFEGAGG